MNSKKILIVEDEPLAAMEVREGLENGGYTVVDVLDMGEDVVDAVARYDPDLLLMDIQLRGETDGVQVAESIRAVRDTPVIFLTAYSDSETLARAAAADPAAYLIKPFSQKELLANVQIALSRPRSGDPQRRELYGAMSLVDALDDPALIADANVRVAHANASAVAILGLGSDSDLSRLPLSRILDIPDGVPRERMEGIRVVGCGTSGVVADMESLLRADGSEYGRLVVFRTMGKRESRILASSAERANETLISMLPGPDAAGPRFRVGGFLEPCPSGSGDIYGVFPAGGGKIAFYSVDVMGHGLLASMMAFALHDVLPDLGRVSGGRVPTPPEVLAALYERYCERCSMPTSFFSIGYGTLDQETGEYRVVRGGHVPALVLKARGGMEIHLTRGAAVGISTDIQVEEAGGVLEPGDRLFLASDGLVDAFDSGNLDQSLRNLGSFSDSLRGSGLDDFVESFRRYTGIRRKTLPVEDDASLLVVERK